MSPEQLQALRQELPELAAAAEPPQSLLGFSQFYGIDHLSATPGLDYRAGSKSDCRETTGQ